MMEQTTVRLPKELLDRARRQAAVGGRTLTAVIEDGLRLVLGKKYRDALGRPRRLPRVSTATGGTLPGVDISNSAAIQEIEDLEYIERMKPF